jgi:hypothetical protein
MTRCIMSIMTRSSAGSPRCFATTPLSDERPTWPSWHEFNVYWHLFIGFYLVGISICPCSMVSVDARLEAGCPGCHV